MITANNNTKYTEAHYRDCETETAGLHNNAVRFNIASRARCTLARIMLSRRQLGVSISKLYACTFTCPIYCFYFIYSRENEVLKQASEKLIIQFKRTWADYHYCKRSETAGLEYLNILIQTGPSIESFQIHCRFKILRSFFSSINIINQLFLIFCNNDALIKYV